MDVIIAHKGAAWMETVTHSKTAHGSMPHLGQNAIIAMNAFLNALQRQLFTTPPHPTLGLPTYSVNEIQGGVAINVVPDHCKCRIDIRTISGQTKSDIQAMFDAAIAEAMAQMPEFNGHYEFVCWLPPVGVDADHEIVAAFCEACGYTPTVRGVNFFTDASALIGNKYIPFVIFGPGDDKLAHQPDEHVKLTNYYASIDIYRRFMNTYKI